MTDSATSQHASSAQLATPRTTAHKAVYIGRFAPSPTGPLHFGSLLAALASYLDARHAGGQWHVRIEDLDPQREDPAASQHILRTLEAYGLTWDGSVCYQSQRHAAYLDGLHQLADLGLAFPCGCSRKQLQGRLHLAGCAHPPNREAGQDYAWRFRVDPQAAPVCFDDRLQGRYCLSPSRDIGDFVIRRRDQLWSYQLAVVLDDHDQGINQIVRGIDLIDSTQRQLLIYQAFGWDAPSYAHIPVATERNGQKLSKQNLALPLQPDHSGQTLWLALDWLGQQPPATLQGAGNHTLLQWAIQHWQPERLHGRHQLPAPAAFQRPGSSDPA
ncbi:tRNA glutamyl-Q(34) synthetase GluQRS [Oceanobacter sp. 5_MG-2023]|uniref:tRNA glutamyl-Q(34) synthetase GluQRS n=1 Tax=Oceanobacter sp. 5_MG-2023 TaxID=3062645 RepID=UPI0026E144B0|nr:tRNA glutamyl-Q(34) synthetase GluQRS [Oceanobacter sp. 5_MG-2023]MDO6683168.1 tRNA glutamyl-Q(34) synthetase GluQRS [Oceanobacter sp. 5_MG-2023]